MKNGGKKNLVNKNFKNYEIIFILWWMFWVNKSEYPSFYEVELQNLHKYEFTCNNSHNVTKIISNPKFEMLFEVWANAIIDWYYREAISSFASSLERFYEISIKTIQLSSWIDNEIIENSWKEISSQSERQLGAFIILWLNFYKYKPLILSWNMTKLRNQVIHKGKIPTRNEAIKFGNEVYSLITKKLEKIIKEDSYKLITSKCEPVQTNKGIFISSWFLQTIISSSFIDKDYKKTNLEDEIKKIKIQRISYKNQLAT